MHLTAGPGGMPRILKLNWKREIQMVDATAEVEVLGVDKGANRDPRWIIVSADILRKHAERLHAVRMVRRSSWMRHTSSKCEPENKPLSEVAGCAGRYRFCTGHRA